MGELVLSKSLMHRNSIGRDLMTMAERESCRHSSPQ